VPLLVAEAHRQLDRRVDGRDLGGDEIWYFTNAASLLLHYRLGFREVTRDFTYPGVTFTGGVGVLCRACL